MRGSRAECVEDGGGWDRARHEQLESGVGEHASRGSASVPTGEGAIGKAGGEGVEEVSPAG